MLSLLLLLAGPPPHVNAIHPEWGPEPPVAPYGQENVPPQPILHPLVFPVLAKYRMDNGYNEQRGKFRHTGIDIRGPKMSPVVAPIAGVIGFKRESFWIYGEDGWAVLGTHMNDDNIGTHDHAASNDLMFAPNLVPGQVVHSGQFIGYLGESGDATAPHLHFEIYEPGAGTTMTRIRNPFSSLKAAQVITAPVIYSKTPPPAKGFIRYDGCIRRIDPDKKLLTVILTAKALSTGESSVITQPRYLRVKLSPEAIEDAGGWDGLAAVWETLPIGLVLSAAGKPDDATVVHIVMPDI
jgi:murein DD-endopeptidase MepM/ murein hydrolase activator NlpD